MRNNNEYSFSDGFSSGGGNGQPSNVIAPTFIQPNPGTYGAPMYGGGFGDGLGGNGLLAGILGASLFGRGFGRDGGNCDNDNSHSHITGSVFGANILSKLGDISGSIPLAASTIQNGLLDQTIGLNNTINQANLSQLQASAGVKDAVQNGTTAVLLNNSQNTQSILGAICNLSSKIDQNLISQLQTELAEQRSSGRTRDLEINVIQNATQLQAQQQQQAQLGSLFGVISNLANDLQSIRQSSVIFNGSGTMTGSGNQTASNTKVA